MNGRPRILFLCTGNACRSQIAEGLLRRLAPERYESLSAGVAPAGFVHPLAAAVSAEVGADIRGNRSKPLDEFTAGEGPRPDLIVVLCDHAAAQLRKHEIAAPVLHWHMPDPITAKGSEDERLCAFRWTRDQICLRLEDALRDGVFESEIGRARQEKPRGYLSKLFSGVASAFRARG